MEHHPLSSWKFAHQQRKSKTHYVWFTCKKCKKKFHIEQAKKPTTPFFCSPCKDLLAEEKLAWRKRVMQKITDLRDKD